MTALSTTVGMTVRLHDQLAEDLKIVAECDGETVTEAIRAAIARYIDWRRSDPNFQNALRARIEHAQRLIEGEATS